MNMTQSPHRVFAMAAIVAGLAATPMLAQPALEFGLPARLTNAELVLTATLPSNVNYRIDVATNLDGLTNGSSWNGLITVPPGPGTLLHTDTAAPYQPKRFYRAQQLAGTNALTGDLLPTTNGDLVIHPVNHASAILAWNGLTIYNDPVGAGTLYASFPRASLILVTHSHPDHYSNTTLDAVRTNGTAIVAPQAVYNSMTTTLRALTTIMTNGSSTTLLGIGIQAIPAYNSNHPFGTGNGYILTIGGRRLLFTGDTGDIAELRGLSGIDVAFVCMNLPYTMSITNAAALVRGFQPRIIYPYHYRNGDNSFPDLNDFKRRVGQDLGIEVRLRKWY